MGIGELILVLLLALLFFGANRLPAVGQGLGKALRNLKGAADATPKRGGTPQRQLSPGPKDGPGA